MKTLKNGKEITTETVSIFGRGTLADQISIQFKGEIKGFYDDFTNIEELNKEIPIIYAVGYKDLYKKRERLESLIKNGYNICSSIAHNSIISEQTKIEDGVIINQGVIIDNFVEIQRGSFINIASSVSHHTIIKESTFIGPGVTIAGNVTIESCVFIGAGACIINDIKIGEGSKIAAGSVVVEDVPPYSLVAGVPAKVKRFLK